MSATSSVFSDLSERAPYRRPGTTKPRQHLTLVTETGTEPITIEYRPLPAWTVSEFSLPEDARKRLLEDQIRPAERHDNDDYENWTALTGSFTQHANVAPPEHDTASTHPEMSNTAAVRHFLEALDRERARIAVHAEIEKRIAALRIIADEEGLPWSDVSLRALRRFLRAYPTTQRPLLTLLDSGNLRALWKDNQGQQVGLQFREPEEIQFVLFAKRPGSVAMTRTAGRDTFDALPKQIAAHGLMRLLFP